MTRRCSSCRSSFQADGAWQMLCWDCWRQRRDHDQEADAYQRGYEAGVRARRHRDYAEGFDAGRRAGLPPDVVEAALRLCHPDRHPPERFAQANATTAHLLEIRQELAA